MRDTETVTSEGTAAPTAVSLLRAMRPRQWTKNALVVAAPLAAGRLDEPDILLRTLAAVACFCLASSAVYLGNDVADRAADRMHPRKRLRPIAAGLVSARLAVCAAALLAVVAVAGAFALDWQFGAVVAAYLLLVRSPP